MESRVVHERKGAWSLGRVWPNMRLRVTPRKNGTHIVYSSIYSKLRRVHRVFTYYEVQNGSMLCGLQVLVVYSTLRDVLPIVDFRTLSPETSRAILPPPRHMGMTVV